MKYISAIAQEQYESALLRQSFTKVYDPLGDVTIDHQTIISTQGVRQATLSGKHLHIVPETSSWVFLTPAETTWLKQANGKSFGWLADNGLPSAETQTANFIGRLFRRGLIQLNGISSLAADIFEDSPNVEEGHLVELLLTEKCNLGCGYCLAGANPRMPTMTDETLTRAIDQAMKMANAHTITFEFSGGEPFLQFPLMQKAMHYAKNHPLSHQKSLYFTVQTNATLLNNERVRWLRDNNVSVGLSVDGNPASHNQSRPMVNGRESFSKVLAGIRLLQDYDVPFGVLIVLNTSNINSEQALIDFLLEHQIYSLKLNPIAFLGTAREKWGQYGLTHTQIIQYFQNLTQLIASNSYPIIEDNLRTMMRYTVSKQRTNRCQRTHCGAGETFQAISANGTIYPCGRATQSPGLALGNVHTTNASLAETGQRHQVVQTIRQHRPRDYDDCRSCLYQQLCQSGCPAQAYESYGTLRHKTPECAFYKTMYPYLMHLLTHNQQAFQHFVDTGYFGRDTTLFDHSFMA